MRAQHPTDAESAANRKGRSLLWRWDWEESKRRQVRSLHGCWALCSGETKFPVSILHVMARWCLARTVTVVSLTVTLSAVAVRYPSCRLLHPLLHPFRELAYSAKNFSPRFNEKDGQVERRSLSGLYEVENGRPRNPSGRTGLVGRGLLGRWGPNHAADPIITRWKRDSSGNKITHPISGKNILQFVAIKRKDCGEWAIPGGMVDPGEKISATLKREFSEEALNSLQKSRAEKEEMEKQMNRLFNQEHFVVYKGYVDDPRNTDNAWIETEAVNYHDEPGETMDNLLLEAGDDAGKVKWVDISEKLKLYANHGNFIKLVAEKWGAHWNEDPVPGCHK
ncbi:ADP-ribose pyrophosphatase, mitochondrial isoform X6 [Chelonia mydas]|uniref:ADP-ribose pyrophosphatase, mitochondrial isoform X6 n=1 Tax=Chelonia mydas TaxID=8469 RepID=UPI001CA9FCFB|nr:ADP-ribose pyrophosphatase, mitochondrial isoform X6 [Chelonia mydas]